MTLEQLIEFLLKSLGILVVILGTSFLVETLTEFFFGTLFDKVPQLTPHKWALMYIAIAVGLVGAFKYQFDLLAILGQFAGSSPVIPVTWYGVALTGVAIGKGSNYLHQFISKFFPKKPQLGQGGS